MLLDAYKLITAGVAEVFALPCLVYFMLLY